MQTSPRATYALIVKAPRAPLRILQTGTWTVMSEEVSADRAMARLQQAVPLLEKVGGMAVIMRVSREGLETIHARFNTKQERVPPYRGCSFAFPQSRRAFVDLMRRASVPPPPRPVRAPPKRTPWGRWAAAFVFGLIPALAIFAFAYNLGLAQRGGPEPAPRVRAPQVQAPAPRAAAPARASEPARVPREAPATTRFGAASEYFRSK